MPDLLNTSDVPLAPTGRTTETVLPDWYTNYAMQILANQGALSAMPYAPYQGPRVADFTADQRTAFDQARTGAMSFDPGLTGAETATSGALNRSGLGAATPGLQTGAGYLASSTSPTGIDLASPFLSGGALSSASDIGSYMDPYNEAVVSRIGELGNRNLTEKLLPAIGDQFVGAGGYGGTRQAETIGRALRDTQEGISAAQSSALSQGYQGALTASAADKARLAGLAGTAGTLGLGQQGALATAGAGIGDIGAKTGALYNTDTNNKLLTAAQMAALADQRQRQTLTGAGALQTVGQQEQALNQSNLDTAYQDFLRQQGWDQTQIDAMTKTLTGVAGAVPKAVLETGYGPVPQTDQAPSTAQTVASLIGAWLLGQGRSG